MAIEIYYSRTDKVLHLIFSSKDVLTIDYIIDSMRLSKNEYLVDIIKAYKHKIY